MLVITKAAPNCDAHEETRRMSDVWMHSVVASTQREIVEQLNKPKPQEGKRQREGAGKLLAGTTNCAQRVGHMRHINSPRHVQLICMTKLAKNTIHAPVCLQSTVSLLMRRGLAPEHFVGVLIIH